MRDVSGSWSFLASLGSRGVSEPNYNMQEEALGRKKGEGMVGREGRGKRGLER